MRDGRGREKERERAGEREREQGVYKRWKERAITGKERHRVNLSLPPSLSPSQQPAIFRDLRSESWKWCIAAGSVWLKDANRRTTTLNQHYLNAPSIFNSPPELRLQPNRVTKGTKTAQGALRGQRSTSSLRIACFPFLKIWYNLHPCRLIPGYSCESFNKGAPPQLGKQ